MWCIRWRTCWPPIRCTLGDLVRIDWDGVTKVSTFVREGEGALVDATARC